MLWRYVSLGLVNHWYWKEQADEKRCVDGYRESLGMARARRLNLQREKISATPPSSPKISRVNRVVSKRLLPKSQTEIREGIWHLSTYLPFYVYAREGLTGRNRLEGRVSVPGILGILRETFASLFRLVKRMFRVSERLKAVVIVSPCSMIMTTVSTVLHTECERLERMQVRSHQRLHLADMSCRR